MLPMPKYKNHMHVGPVVENAMHWGHLHDTRQWRIHKYSRGEANYINIVTFRQASEGNS